VIRKNVRHDETLLIPASGGWYMLEDLKDRKKTIGVKQTIKAVEAGLAGVVYIAGDAEEHVVADLKELCRKNSVKVVITESMKQLGKACGIDVGASTASELK
jgi:large subunit ribosomal protein L7A